MHISEYTDGTGGPMCGREGPTTSDPKKASCDWCEEELRVRREIEDPTLDEIRQDLEWRTV